MIWHCTNEVPSRSQHRSIFVFVKCSLVIKDSLLLFVKLETDGRRRERTGLIRPRKKGGSQPFERAINLENNDGMEDPSDAIGEINWRRELIRSEWPRNPSILPDVANSLVCTARSCLSLSRRSPVSWPKSPSCRNPKAITYLVEDIELRDVRGISYIDDTAAFLQRATMGNPASLPRVISFRPNYTEEDGNRLRPNYGELFHHKRHRRCFATVDTLCYG